MPGEYLPISEGWSDDLYITFQSSIGPNIVDILIYIIDNYTDLSFDQASFNYVRTKLARFRPIFRSCSGRTSSRCSRRSCSRPAAPFWLEDDVVYLKYLPEEPTPVDSLTVSDMDAERGVEIELMPTEDIVTKMNVKWHLSYAGGGEYAPNEADTTQYMVLRHNVKRYGLQEKEYEWYIFNQPDIILKCATFWLIRLSNAWKRVKFRTYLHKLNLEAFDSVTFSVPGYIAAGAGQGGCGEGRLQLGGQLHRLRVRVPVKAGKMTQDPFYWPANLPISERWPPQEDITNGDAGGGGIGGGASGQLPVGTVAGIGVTGAIFVGGPNVVFRGQSDWGDPTPTDVGFQAQPTTSPDQFGNVNATPWPVLDLQMSFLNHTEPLPDLDVAAELTIDLAKTKVMDSSSDNRQQFGYLRGLLTLGDQQDVQIDLSKAKIQDAEAGGMYAPLSDMLQISEDNGLMIDGSTKFVTDDAPDGAEFDFKFDPDGGKLVQGRRFCKTINH